MHVEGACCVNPAHRGELVLLAQDLGTSGRGRGRVGRPAQWQVSQPGMGPPPPPPRAPPPPPAALPPGPGPPLPQVRSPAAATPNSAHQHTSLGCLHTPEETQVLLRCEHKTKLRIANCADLPEMPVADLHGLKFTRA